MKADVQPFRARSHSYLLRSVLFSFGLVFIALAAISAVSYQTNRSFLLAYIKEINQQQLESTAGFLDSLFFRASYTSAGLATRNEVYSYLNADVTDPRQVRQLEQSIEGLLSLIDRSNSEVASAYIYSRVRNRVVTDTIAVDLSRFSDPQWIQFLPQTPADRAVLKYRTPVITGTPTISIIRRIDEGGTWAGGVVININVDQIRRELGAEGVDGESRLYIVQRPDEVIFAPDNSLLGTSTIPQVAERANSVFAVTRPGQLFNLEYYAYGGQNLFQQKIEALRRFLIGLLGSVLVLGAILSLILATFAYSPIRRIVRAIQHPEQSAGLSSGNRTDEVRYIEQAVIQLVASNRQLEERLADRFRSLKRAHAVALQLQLNPHFLYNTLESIYWSSIEAFSESDIVPQSVSALSRFLRLVLNTDTMAVPLEEEIELTRLYARILELRFPGGMELSWDIAEDTMRRLVPKLMLQPLVENAFYHGIKPTRRPGRLCIASRRIPGGTRITVTDNGVGMAVERLAEVRDRLDNLMDLSEDHIGLLNVSQRLRILFDESAELRLVCPPGGGTQVVIDIPASQSLPG